MSPPDGAPSTRSQLAEQTLVSELEEISAWLGDLERRAHSTEPVGRRVRRLRRVAARLDTRIRLIRDLRQSGRAGRA
jgi:hypothetical protein